MEYLIKFNDLYYKFRKFNSSLTLKSSEAKTDDMVRDKLFSLKLHLIHPVNL